MKSCSRTGCANDMSRRGLCQMHYQRALRGKEPMPPRIRLTLADRFNASFTRGDGCWEWQGTRARRGYGRIKLVKRTLIAHRVAWELTNGPIPPGMFVCHKCDNPPCVNPDHLFLGTGRDNTRDAVGKGRTARGERHPNALLTADAVRAIREMDGLATTADIAALFGVLPATVRAVIRNKNWRHV